MCLCTHLPTLVCNQGSKWLGVKAAVAESQATVHTVSSQLQSLLTDVVLRDKNIPMGKPAKISAAQQNIQQQI